jgi:hypothetical protein
LIGIGGMWCVSGFSSAGGVDAGVDGANIDEDDDGDELEVDEDAEAGLYVQRSLRFLHVAQSPDGGSGEH